MMRAAIGKIVAIDRRYDNVLKLEACHSATDPSRLVEIEMRWPPGRDVAESAGARADVAHDHHGCVPLLPALSDIRAGGLFANGMQAVFAHDGMRAIEARRAGSPDAKPGRLRQLRGIRSRCLFRVAKARSEAGGIEERYQGFGQLTSWELG
jgi:hypothetical protein